MMKHRESVLITGSAGLLGRKLSRKLAEEGRSVIAVFHKRVPEQRTDVIPIQSDFKDLSNLIAALKSVSTVVHLAWDWGGTASGRNVLMLEALLHAMETAKTRRIIFPSFHGASLHNPDLLLKEKFFCEERILSSRIKEKSILRSYPLVDAKFSEESGLVQGIRSLMYFPLVYPVLEAKVPMQWTQVEDFVERLMFAVDRQPLNDEYVHFEELQSTLHHSGVDLFKKIAETVGARRKFPLPTFMSESLLPLFTFVAERRQKKKALALPAQASMVGSEWIDYLRPFFNIAKTPLVLPLDGDAAALS